MKLTFVILPALVLSACASWTPRAPEEIVADRQRDRQVSTVMTDMARERGADGFTTGSGF